MSRRSYLLRDCSELQNLGFELVRNCLAVGLQTASMFSTVGPFAISGAISLGVVGLLVQFVINANVRNQRRQS